MERESFRTATAMVSAPFEGGTIKSDPRIAGGFTPGVVPALAVIVTPDIE